MFLYTEILRNRLVGQDDGLYSFLLGRGERRGRASRGGLALYLEFKITRSVKNVTVMT